MERATNLDKDRWYINGAKVRMVFHSGTGEIRLRGQDIDRLAAYEDTGLEPEEVAKIREDVENGYMKSTARRYGISVARLRELAQADREGRCVVLNMPRKPLVWGDGDKNTCLCPYCGKDLMGIPYGERMVLQCPECGQYLDATKVITRAEDTLREDTNG